jgi:hypothetical protein
MSVQRSPQNVSHDWQLLHDPWMQAGVAAEQTYPQAPQLFESELTLVHIPWQHAVPVGQQANDPQLPQIRLVLPLHARQAARH